MEILAAIDDMVIVSQTEHQFENDKQTLKFPSLHYEQR